MVVADIRHVHLLPAFALCCYISVVVILMIARYHQNLTIVLRSPFSESEMRNDSVNKITDITCYDEHIANRFQRQRLHEAHTLMKLHVQVRAILNLHYQRFIGFITDRVTLSQTNYRWIATLFQANRFKTIAFLARKFSRCITYPPKSIVLFRPHISRGETT